MPFNLLLLPLIAGFWFISRNFLFRYSTSALAKEALLLYASVAGLSFLATSRLICWGLLKSESGFRLATLLHGIAPFPYVGTATGTLLLSLSLTWMLNRLVTERTASRWCFHNGRFREIETFLLRGVLGPPEPYAVMSRLRLMLGEIANRLPEAWKFVRKYRHSLPDDPLPGAMLMINLSNGKVYVGAIVSLPPIHAASFDYVRLIPAWSGYRASNQTIRITTPYPGEAFTDPQQRFVKLIPVKNIASVSLYVDDVFEIPQDGDNLEVDDPPPPTRERNGRRRNSNRKRDRV